MNIDKITTDGKALYLAYDHGVEHGPVDLIGKSIDPSYILDIAVKGGYNAIVLQEGIAEKYYYPDFKDKMPLILKLNGKSSLVGGEPISKQICSVKEAKRLGASGVGYTIYLGSEHEPEMLREFSEIEDEAHREGMVVLVWVYPRGKSIKDDKSPEITAYAARMALEVGADIAKIKYCGSTECFKMAVQSAGKTKVVLSGGVKTSDPEDFLNVVRSVMKAGAIGVAVGRNVWQSENPLGITRRIKEIIWNDSKI
ncbi:MAG: aldolase [Patescibacteria group bacterium]